MALTAGLAICQHHRRPFRIFATSLRSGTRQGLGAWIASTLFQTALFTANTLVLGDAIST
jgi:hypothetical protein